MKANADRTAPDTNHGTWKSNESFFHKGTSGQWADALSEESQSLYTMLTRKRYDAEMLNWLEQGSRATARPG